MNPILPLAGLGAIAFLLTRPKAAVASPYGLAPPAGVNSNTLPMPAAPPPVYQQAAPVVYPAAPAPAPAAVAPATITPEPPAAARPTSSMPEVLKQQMAIALGKLGVHPFTGELAGTANAESIRFATQLIGQLESQGYYQAANDLRGYVNKAAVHVPSPPEAAPIAAAAPPGLTQEQKDRIARVLSLERSPQSLLQLINWLKTLPASAARDATISMATALRLGVLEAQTTSETMQRIEEVVKSPGLPQVQTATRPPTPLPAPVQSNPNPVRPPAPAVVAPPVAPAPPPPAAVLPEQPAAVPPKPVPQPLPRQLSPAEQAVTAMFTHLGAIQSQYGTPKAARRHMDTTLVKRAQRALGVKADAKPGPGTFLKAAALAPNVPLVMFWPSRANAAYVRSYRNKLIALADQYQAQSRPQAANTLRMHAALERGQGGIVGPLA